MHITAVLFLGLIIYSGTFNAPFAFDDKEIYTFKNLPIRDLRYFFDASALNSLSSFTARGFFSNRFIGHLSFALNYRFNGLDVTGYHIVNLAIHLLNAVLIYRLVLLTFSTTFFTKAYAGRSPVDAASANYMALFASLIFVSHPVQTQAVTYISQRFASLATLFYLLSLVLYIKSREQSPGQKQHARIGLLYAGSLLCCVLAMKTKEIAFTLPAVIALYEFMFLNGKPGKRTLLLIPFLFTMAIIPYCLIAMDNPYANKLSEIRLSSMPRTDYLFTEFRVIVTYLRLLLLPVGQNLDYDYPAYHSFFAPQVFLSFLLLAGMLVTAGYFFVRSRRQNPVLRLISFGIFYFFIALSVESSFVPIPDLIFEHRLYLPSAGFVMSAAGTIALLLGKVGESGRARTIVTLALFVVVGFYSYAAYARNLVWNDEVTLWEDVVLKSPGKARPHINLGAAYEERGRFTEAERELRSGVALGSANFDFHNRLGTYYTRRNRLAEAQKEFDEALRLRPLYADTYVNLGIVHEKAHRVADALRDYRIALALDPKNAEAHNNLGALFSGLKRSDDAELEFRSALGLNPYYADAHYNLAVVLQRRGKPEDALQGFRTALRLKPEFAEAHNNLGAIYAGQNRLQDALQEFETALRLKPDYPDAYNNVLAVQEMLKNNIK
jgi:Tfp pilus assembly protein PilF